MLLAFTVPVVRSEAAGGPDAGPGWRSTSSTGSGPSRPGVAVPVFAFFSAGVAVGGLSGLGAARSATASRSGSSSGWSPARRSASPRPPGWSPASPAPSSTRTSAGPTSLGLSLLGGIGFTVSLLISELAYGAGVPQRRPREGRDPGRHAGRRAAGRRRPAAAQPAVLRDRGGGAARRRPRRRPGRLPGGRPPSTTRPAGRQSTITCGRDRPGPHGALPVDRHGRRRDGRRPPHGRAAPAGPRRLRTGWTADAGSCRAPRCCASSSPATCRTTPRSPGSSASAPPSGCWASCPAATVRDLLPSRPDTDLAVANPDDTVLELAALMARLHSPLVAVVEDDLLAGCVTLPRVLDVLLDPSARHDDLRHRGLRDRLWTDRRRRRSTGSPSPSTGAGLMLARGRRRLRAGLPRTRDRGRLGGHLPAARDDDHRRRPQPHRRVRVRRHPRREVRPRPPVPRHGAADPHHRRRVRRARQRDHGAARRARDAAGLQPARTQPGALPAGRGLRVQHRRHRDSHRRPAQHHHRRPRAG